ncbi:MAG TPA: MFS transporter [Coleofasciculaceae cyanobacterium]|jgi:MFS family permease
MMKLITLLLMSSLTVMAGAAIAPALPQIQQAFATTPNSEFWVKLMLTLPGLFTAIGAPISGSIIDRFGRKPLLIAAMIIYGLAGGVAGLTLNSIPALLAARALLGLAVAAVMTASLALIADYYDGAQRNQVMGIQAAFMGFGGVVFLMLAGFLAGLNWRMPFVVYLLTFAVLPLVWIFLPEPPRASTPKLGDLAISRDQLPVKTLAIVYGLNFVIMLAFYMTPVQLPFYLQTLGSVSSSEVGIAIAATTLANAISSMRYGSLKSKFSFTHILVILLVMMGIGYSIVAFGNDYSTILLGQLLVGFGLGFAMPNMNVWVSGETPASLRGKALGGLTTSMFLGQFFCPILTQPLVQQLGFRQTYGVIAGMLGVIALIIYLMMRDRSTPLNSRA